MKKVFSLLLVLLMVLSVAVPGMAAGKAKTKITLDKKGTVELKLGETLQLTATVSTGATPTWKSSKKSVATVENGLVTPVKEGKATITAKAGGKTAKVTVKVVDPAKPTKLALKEGKKATLDIDKTLKLTPVFTPSTASSDLTYKTSKKSVATVENGVVVPHKEGKAKITVTSAKNKKAKATITITVKDPYKPTKLAINQGKKQTLTEGGSLQLTITPTPSTARKDLTFKSSKKSVATVDANGKVTAIKKGTAKITVTSKSNKKAKATITVKVNKAAPSKDLIQYLNQPASVITKKLGLKATFVPEITEYDIEGNGVRVFAGGKDLAKTRITTIIINGKNDYTLFGVSYDMSKDKALAALRAAGWSYTDNDIELDEDDMTEHLIINTNSKYGVACYARFKDGKVCWISAERD